LVTFPHKCVLKDSMKTFYTKYVLYVLYIILTFLGLIFFVALSYMNITLVFVLNEKIQKGITTRRDFLCGKCTKTKIVCVEVPKKKICKAQTNPTYIYIELCENVLS